MSDYYLPAGLPSPRPMADGLDAPYWNGLAQDELILQRCNSCRTWQWGPEWICNACLGSDIDWTRTPAKGRIFSWERAWHPSHPALKDHGPYLIVLVELPEAGNVRVIGNLLGDPLQEVVIGSEVEGVFEHHTDAEPRFSLLHWKLVG